MDWAELIGGVTEQVLIAVLPVLAGLVSAWLIAQIRRLWGQANNAMSENWRWTLEEGALLVVRAAQQLWEENQEKKDYAVATLQAYLNERGLKADIALIEAAIEAAVLQEFNKPAG